MATPENKGNTDSMYDLSRSFQAEPLNVPAFVEIHKNHGRMIGLVFHVGEFSLPLLRARPVQRIHDGMERNPLRPWLMGRVTHKKKVLLENPGQPGIVLKSIPDNPPVAGNGHKNALLSATVWINGERRDFSTFFPGQDHNYCYEKIPVTATPVLEQHLQSGPLKVRTELILSPDGPVQRATIEAVEAASAEVDYGFIGLLPEGVTEVYAHDYRGTPLEAHLGIPSEGNEPAAVVLPHAKWLATYDPDQQFGTLVHSPDFEKANMSHRLIVDRRQGFRVYHVVGHCAPFGMAPPHTESPKLTVRRGHPRQLALVARPIEAEADAWKKRADEVSQWVVKSV
jgi:hypothetical protein